MFHSRRSTIRPAAFLALLLTAAAAAAEPAASERPLLWRISGEAPSYLYGTIHVSDPRVVALPEAVTSALDASEVFCSEVLLDAESQSRMAAASLLPGDATLQQVLPDELYRRTAKHLAQRGIPITMLEKLRVWSLAGLLVALDELQSRPMQPSLDELLHRRAIGAGKRLDALERIQDQLQVFDSMGPEGERAMLRQTLDYLEEIPPGAPGPLERLIQAWLAGDAEKLMQVSLEYADPDDPLTARFLEALLDRRNIGMAAGIERRVLAHPESGYFFAVGALHLPGPEGILARLRARGFQVERVEPPPRRH